MNYSFFLFTKLFDVIIDVNYEYDALFEDLQTLYEGYQVSSFNDPNKGEYECMVEYLQHHRKEILVIFLATLSEYQN